MSQVAFKTFVDSVAVLAIEQCLLQKLPSLFSPDVVLEMKDEDVSRLAAESEETSAERSRYEEKLIVLESGLSDLQRLDKHRTLFETGNAAPILCVHPDILGRIDIYLLVFWEGES